MLLVFIYSSVATVRKQQCTVYQQISRFISLWWADHPSRKQDKTCVHYWYSLKCWNDVKITKPLKKQFKLVLPPFFSTRMHMPPSIQQCNYVQAVVQVLKWWTISLSENDTQCGLDTLDFWWTRDILIFCSHSVSALFMLKTFQLDLFIVCSVMAAWSLCTISFLFILARDKSEFFSSDHSHYSSRAGSLWYPQTLVQVIRQHMSSRAIGRLQVHCTQYCHITSLKKMKLFSWRLLLRQCIPCEYTYYVMITVFRDILYQ